MPLGKLFKIFPVIGANLESTNFIKADLGLLALLALILQSIFCCIYLFPLLIH